MSRDDQGRFSGPGNGGSPSMAEPFDWGDTKSALTKGKSVPSAKASGGISPGSPDIPEFGTMNAVQAQLAEVGNSGGGDSGGSGEAERYEIPEDEPVTGDIDRMTMRGENEIGSRHYSLDSDTEDTSHD